MTWTRNDQRAAEYAGYVYQLEAEIERLRAVSIITDEQLRIARTERDEVIEECALVVEGLIINDAGHVAAAIRALKDKP